MVCEVCGKTMYWCIGHTPYRAEVPYRPPATHSGDPS